MEEEEEIIDAIIVDEIRSSAAGSIEDQSLSFLDPTTAEGQLRKRDVAARVLGRLADLSLQDYEWRSAVFKENEADRAVEVGEHYTHYYWPHEVAFIGKVIY